MLLEVSGVNSTGNWPLDIQMEEAILLPCWCFTCSLLHTELLLLSAGSGVVGAFFFWVKLNTRLKSSFSLPSLGEIYKPVAQNTASLLGVVIVALLGSHVHQSRQMAIIHQSWPPWEAKILLAFFVHTWPYTYTCSHNQPINVLTHPGVVWLYCRKICSCCFSKSHNGFEFRWCQFAN